MKIYIQLFNIKKCMAVNMGGINDQKINWSYWNGRIDEIRIVKKLKKSFI